MSAGVRVLSFVFTFTIYSHALAVRRSLAICGSMSMFFVVAGINGARTQLLVLLPNGLIPRIDVVRLAARIFESSLGALNVAHGAHGQAAEAEPTPRMACTGSAPDAAGGGRSRGKDGHFQLGSRRADDVQ